MNECGKVINIKRKTCTVSFDRTSACDKCRMCAVNKSGKTVEIVLPNKVNAEVGDTVDVSMSNKYVLTAAMIVYIIPLITVAIGVIIGSFYSVILQTILVFVGLAVGLVIAIIIDHTVIKKKKGFVPTIEKIVKKAGDEDIVENNVENNI